jgi:hypothetical protein
MKNGLNDENEDKKIGKNEETWSDPVSRYLDI